MTSPTGTAKSTGVPGLTAAATEKGKPEKASKGGDE